MYRCVGKWGQICFLLKTCRGESCIATGHLQAAGGTAIDLASLSLAYSDHSDDEPAVGHFID